MALLKSNFATGRLSTLALDTDTALLLSTGNGSKFPSPTGGDIAVLVLEDSSGNKEIVHLTARNGDTLTVTRARENTVALQFPVGSRVEVRITNAVLEDFVAMSPVSGKDQIITARLTTDIPLGVKKLASQTSNLFQITDETDADLFTVSSAGVLGLGSAVTVTPTATSLDVAGDILPATDNTYDLGSSSAAWADVWFEGKLGFAEGGTTTYVDFNFTTYGSNAVFNNLGIKVTGNGSGLYLGGWTSSGGGPRITGTGFTTGVFYQAGTNIATGTHTWWTDASTTVMTLSETSLFLQDINLSVQGNVLPTPTNTYDLGSATLQWRNLYVGNQINFENSSATLEYVNAFTTGTWPDSLRLANAALAVDTIYLSSRSPTGWNSVIGNSGTSILYQAGGGDHIWATESAAGNNEVMRITDFGEVKIAYDGFTNFDFGGYVLQTSAGGAYIDGSSVIDGELKLGGDFYPSVTGTYDLGTATLKWQDMHLGGVANIYRGSAANFVRMVSTAAGANEMWLRNSSSSFMLTPAPAGTADFNNVLQYDWAESRWEFTGELWVGGDFRAAGTITNFTSTGIDDNATAEALDITDDVAIWGNATDTAFTHRRADDDGYMTLAGGGNINGGGNIRLFGQTHATLAGDIQFRNGTDEVGRYDDSVDTWTWSGLNHVFDNPASGCNVYIGSATATNAQLIFRENGVAEAKINWAAASNLLNVEATGGGAVWLQETGEVRFMNNGVESARVTSTGELLVGTTDSTLASNVTGEGVAISSDNIQVARAAGAGISVNRQTDEGACIGLYEAGTFRGSLAINTNAPVLLGSTGQVLTPDYYGEGTFSPTIRGGTAAGTGTYTTQYGRYTRVGNLVTCWGYIVWTAHSGTGTLDRIAGLPFTADNTGYPVVANVQFHNISTMAANASPTGLVLSNTTEISVYESAGGSITKFNMDTAGTAYFNVSYQVA